MEWPRGGCRRPRHGAGVASRIPRDSVCDSGLRPGQLAAAARHGAGWDGRGCRSHAAAGCLAAGWAWHPREALEQQLAQRAKDLDLAMNPALTASPPRMPGSDRRVPLGVPGPESGRSPATATLAGPGGHAPLPRPTGAPLQQPARTMRGRSAGGTRRRAAGRNARSKGPARRNLRWARAPLIGPALELCGVKFAKSVMRQGLCGPTPHYETLNITAGTNSCRAGFAPAEAQCLFTAHDSIVPLEEGGPDTLENLQTLCVPCHLRKHGKAAPLSDIAAWKRAVRELADEVDGGLGGP